MARHRSGGEVSELLARTADVQQEADGLPAFAGGDAPGRRRRDRGRMLRRCYGATADSVSLARRAVVRLARVNGLPETRLEAVRLAVSEAVTNVVLHAYGDGGGHVHLTAAVAGDELVVLVADDGCGPRIPPQTHRAGWGWTVIAAVTDEFTISQRPNGGTHLEMRWRVGETASGPGRGLTRPDDVLLAPPRFSTPPQVERGSLGTDSETTGSP